MKRQKQVRSTKPIICIRRILTLTVVLLLTTILLPADEILLDGFPQGKWLDTNWQAYWTFGTNSIRLLDVHDQEIYNFAGVVQNMKVTSLPNGGVRLMFDCAQAKRSYLFEKTSDMNPMQMVIHQQGRTIAYKMMMPQVSDSQLDDYKAAVIAEKPAGVAKIVAAIENTPSSAKVAQQAKQAQEQTDMMLALAAKADFDQLERITTKAENQEILDLMIQALEAEAAKTEASPSVFISLSVLYGRKNLKTQSYAALELAEQAQIPPDMTLNISLLYGRKKLLAGAPDAKTFLVGELEILSVPDEVMVYLDGVEKGSGSLRLSSIEAGTHTIKCIHPDYEDFSMTLELGVGQTKQVKVNQIKKPYIPPYLLIPTRSIKIDGKKEDWDGIPALATDTTGDDPIGNRSGTDLASVYMAQDDSTVYCRIDFVDGKPAPQEGDIYEIILRRTNQQAGNVWDEQMELRLQYNLKQKNLVSKVNIITKKAEKKSVDGKNTGIFRIGVDFMEFAFPVKDLQEYLNSTNEFSALPVFWMSSTSSPSTPSIVDKINSVLVRFH